MPIETLLYYWDSCMFISHVHRRNVAAQLLDAIDEISLKVDSMEVNLCTSVIAFIETSRIRLLNDKAKLERYDQFFNRRNVVPVNVDQKVIALATELNDFYAPMGKTLGVADALHIATACLYGAKEFHTRDGSGRGKKLIGLETVTPSGLILDRYELRIIQPRPEKPRLQFSVPE